MKIDAKPVEMKCEYMHNENHDFNFAATLVNATDTKIGAVHLQQHRT